MSSSFCHVVNCAWGTWILLITLVSVSSAARLYCEQDERLKDGKCEKCPICSRGQGLTEECGGGGASNATCVVCVEGQTFSNGQNSARCKPCRQCSLYNRENQLDCRSVVDAECGACLPGYYESYGKTTSLQPCEHCSMYPGHPQCNPWSTTVKISTDVYSAKHSDKQGTALDIKVQGSTEDTRNWYETATVILSVSLVLCIAVIVLLAFVLVRRKRHTASDINGNRRNQKDNCRQENPGTNTTASFGGNNHNNEDDRLLPQVHPYEVLPDGEVQELRCLNQGQQPSTSSGISSKAPVSLQTPPSIRGEPLVKEARAVLVDQSKAEVSFVKAGDAEGCLAAMAAPIGPSQPLDALNNFDNMMPAPEELVMPLDDDDEDDRGSGVFSQASTLPVRSCCHSEHDSGANLVDPAADNARLGDVSSQTCSLSEQSSCLGQHGPRMVPRCPAGRSTSTLDTTSLNDCNRFNTVGDQQAMPAVHCWRNIREQDAEVRPNITTPGNLQRPSDPAAIQITIHNTIGKAVVAQKSLKAVSEEPEDSSDQSMDETEVKRPTCQPFRRSCSLEEKTSESFHLPIQESLISVEAC